VEIVKRYEEFPVESFRKMFLKIREQLDEIENSNFVDQNSVDLSKPRLKCSKGHDLQTLYTMPEIYKGNDCHYVQCDVCDKKIEEG